MNFIKIEPQIIDLDKSVKVIKAKSSLIFINAFKNSGVLLNIEEANVLIKIVLLKKEHHMNPCVSIKIKDGEFIHLNNVSESAEVFYDGNTIIRIR